MGGQLALQAEIVDGPHQSLAEDKLPVAIHGHAGRERIVRSHEPAGQAQAVARRSAGSEPNARGTRAALVARLVVLPARQHVRRPGFGSISCMTGVEMISLRSSASCPLQLGHHPAVSSRSSSEP